MGSSEYQLRLLGFEACYYYYCSLGWKRRTVILTYSMGEAFWKHDGEGNKQDTMEATASVILKFPEDTEY